LFDFQFRAIKIMSVTAEIVTAFYITALSQNECFYSIEVNIESIYFDSDFFNIIKRIITFYLMLM